MVVLQGRSLPEILFEFLEEVLRRICEVRGKSIMAMVVLHESDRSHREL